MFLEAEARAVALLRVPRRVDDGQLLRGWARGEEFIGQAAADGEAEAAAERSQSIRSVNVNGLD